MNDREERAAATATTTPKQRKPPPLHLQQPPRHQVRDIDEPLRRALVKAGIFTPNEAERQRRADQDATDSAEIGAVAPYMVGPAFFQRVYQLNRPPFNNNAPRFLVDLPTGTLMPMPAFLERMALARRRAEEKEGRRRQPHLILSFPPPSSNTNDIPSLVDGVVNAIERSHTIGKIATAAIASSLLIGPIVCIHVGPHKVHLRRCDNTPTRGIYACYRTIEEDRPYFVATQSQFPLKPLPRVFLQPVVAWVPSVPLEFNDGDDDDDDDDDDQKRGGASKNDGKLATDDDNDDDDDVTDAVDSAAAMAAQRRSDAYMHASLTQALPPHQQHRQGGLPLLRTEDTSSLVHMIVNWRDCDRQHCRAKSRHHCCSDDGRDDDAFPVSLADVIRRDSPWPAMTHAQLVSLVMNVASEMDALDKSTVFCSTASSIYILNPSDLGKPRRHLFFRLCPTALSLENELPDGLARHHVHYRQMAVLIFQLLTRTTTTTHDDLSVYVRGDDMHCNYISPGLWRACRKLWSVSSSTALAVRIDETAATGSSSNSRNGNNVNINNNRALPICAAALSLRMMFDLKWSAAIASGDSGGQQYVQHHHLSDTLLSHLPALLTSMMCPDLEHAAVDTLWGVLSSKTILAQHERIFRVLADHIRCIAPRPGYPWSTPMPPFFDATGSGHSRATATAATNSNAGDHSPPSVSLVTITPTGMLAHADIWMQRMYIVAKVLHEVERTGDWARMRRLQCDLMACGIKGQLNSMRRKSASRLHSIAAAIAIIRVVVLMCFRFSTMAVKFMTGDSHTARTMCDFLMNATLKGAIDYAERDRMMAMILVMSDFGRWCGTRDATVDKDSSILTIWRRASRDKELFLRNVVPCLSHSANPSMASSAQTTFAVVSMLEDMVLDTAQLLIEERELIVGGASAIRHAGFRRLKSQLEMALSMLASIAWHGEEQIQAASGHSLLASRIYAHIFRVRGLPLVVAAPLPYTTRLHSSSSLARVEANTERGTPAFPSPSSFAALAATRTARTTRKGKGTFHESPTGSSSSPSSFSSPPHSPPPSPPHHHPPVVVAAIKPVPSLRATSIIPRFHTALNHHLDVKSVQQPQLLPHPLSSRRSARRDGDGEEDLSSSVCSIKRCSAPTLSAAKNDSRRSSLSQQQEASTVMFRATYLVENTGAKQFAALTAKFNNNDDNDDDDGDDRRRPPPLPFSAVAAAAAATEFRCTFEPLSTTEVASMIDAAQRNGEPVMGLSHLDLLTPRGVMGAAPTSSDMCFLTIPHTCRTVVYAGKQQRGDAESPVTVARPREHQHHRRHCSNTVRSVTELEWASQSASFVPMAFTPVRLVGDNHHLCQLRSPPSSSSSVSAVGGGTIGMLEVMVSDSGDTNDLGVGLTWKTTTTTTRKSPKSTSIIHWDGSDDDGDLSTITLSLATGVIRYWNSSARQWTATPYTAPCSTNSHVRLGVTSTRQVYAMVDHMVYPPVDGFFIPLTNDDASNKEEDDGDENEDDGDSTTIVSIYALVEIRCFGARLTTRALAYDWSPPAISNIIDSCGNSDDGGAVVAGLAPHAESNPVAYALHLAKLRTKVCPHHYAHLRPELVRPQLNDLVACGKEMETQLDAIDPLIFSCVRFIRLASGACDASKSGQLSHSPLVDVSQRQLSSSRKCAACLYIERYVQKLLLTRAARA
ncbi:MAG: hypothetical protein WC763_05750 [Candidatus Paceibacterota bacterium]|jgi:hypothetical protein